MHCPAGLICLNWYDWNTAIITNSKCISWCRDWSAWIDTIETHMCYRTLHHPSLVGIDLPELIRLKLYIPFNNGSVFITGRDWSAWIDTIETSCISVPYFVCTNGRDWSAWIDTIETSSISGIVWKVNHCRDWSAWIDTIETPLR